MLRVSSHNPLRATGTDTKPCFVEVPNAEEPNLMLRDDCLILPGPLPYCIGIVYIFARKLNRLMLDFFDPVAIHETTCLPTPNWLELLQ